MRSRKREEKEAFILNSGMSEVTRAKYVLDGFYYKYSKKCHSRSNVKKTRIQRKERRSTMAMPSVPKEARKFRKCGENPKNFTSTESAIFPLNSVMFLNDVHVES